ncbi:hypothetical protein [Candidatus Leptofilum sp.]|uniref:hypothetical protein n=1 Tax=Candidatus Leptofilum sp. TaxID=3241576 RepID=UPI003B5C72F5
MANKNKNALAPAKNSLLGRERLKIYSRGATRLKLKQKRARDSALCVASSTLFNPLTINCYLGLCPDNGGITDLSYSLSKILPKQLPDPFDNCAIVGFSAQLFMEQ